MLPPMQSPNFPPFLKRASATPRGSTVIRRSRTTVCSRSPAIRLRKSARCSAKSRPRTAKWRFSTRSSIRNTALIRARRGARSLRSRFVGVRPPATARRSRACTSSVRAATLRAPFAPAPTRCTTNSLFSASSSTTASICPLRTAPASAMPLPSGPRSGTAAPPIPRDRNPESPSAMKTTTAATIRTAPTPTATACRTAGNFTRWPVPRRRKGCMSSLRRGRASIPLSAPSRSTRPLKASGRRSWAAPARTIPTTRFISAVRPVPTDSTSCANSAAPTPAPTMPKSRRRSSVTSPTRSGSTSSSRPIRGASIPTATASRTAPKAQPSSTAAPPTTANSGRFPAAA